MALLNSVRFRKHRSIGSMRCPRCDADMEQIEEDAENQLFDDLQLCPSCYLVTWSDQNGFHSQQGIPVPKNLTCLTKKGEIARVGMASAGPEISTLQRGEKRGRRLHFEL